MLLSLTEKEWKERINRFSTRLLRKKHDEILEDTKRLILEAVKKNIPKGRFGILFSGGVDSTLIAKICRDKGEDFTCYTSALKEKGMKKAEDAEYAKKAADIFGLDLRVKTIGLDETERHVKKILKILKEPNVVKVGVALPFFLAFEEAKKDNIKVMLSGLGPEELFAGYERHEKAKNINKECLKGLLSMHERDITRDLAIARANGIVLRVPYLDERLVEYSLRIPARFKLGRKGNKLILREAAEDMGLGDFAWRKKRAAQYGSRFDRAIQKLAKRKGFKHKKDYLKILLEEDAI
ncbi:asparagine synthase C-terminal domain-containing protein [Candidatus Woesearchaeota archaeon]|nr:asparagine synthase C-terminal domain-containing protein [Candidatus Woesearchaeota archaeon]